MDAIPAGNGIPLVASTSERVRPLMGQAIMRPSIRASSQNAICIKNQQPPGLPRARSCIQDGDGIGFVGHEAQELEGLVAGILIPMGDLGGDKDNIAWTYFKDVRANANASVTVEHVLFMLDQVGMVRHPSAGPDHKASHGKVRTFFRGNQDLHGDVRPGVDRFGFDSMRMFDRHEMTFLFLATWKMGTVAIANIHSNRST
jgi:hypothetical protein